MNVDEAMTLLTQVVQAKGRDHVYKKPESGLCFNFHPETGEPDCIVGHVMALAGVTATDLNEQPSSPVGYFTGGNYEKSDLTFAASEMLGIAQDLQDQGKTWGEAYDAAYYYYQGYMQGGIDSDSEVGAQA